MVAQTRSQKLVSDRLHAVDATAVQSKVNIWRWRDGGGKDDAPKSGGGGGGLEKWEGLCWGAARIATPASVTSPGPSHALRGYKAHVAVDVDAQIVVGLVTANPSRLVENG